MTASIAINGFGRIGRMVFRQAIVQEDINVVAINVRYPLETLAHLIKYDSTHGTFEGEISIDNDALIVNGKRVQIVNDRDPANLPWGKLNVDIVIESTGKFNDGEKAAAHLEAGAKKVIITAPAKNEDVTIVIGVNDDKLDVAKHNIISNASCTTNCLAPVAKVLNDTFGIENGLMTTVHSYTNDQNNLDNPHKDLRRARACAQSIIPTSTGAAKALTIVLPELEGKMHGMALRVPTPNVSLVDLVVDLQKDVTAEEVNAAFVKASEGSMKGILGVTMEPLVSIDFNTTTNSTTIDGLTTMVIGNRKVKVLAWYDNEWGYSARVVDLTKKVASSL
ncbi:MULTISPECIES: glyceraldehyde-3-phosphate dehydrogenase [Bacillaceae]|uniref:glyceraldehyde-3-phosphate dehydrogenase n=1 Tax=Bacillaceae TaxID=186817 RepID=UPI0006ADB8A7|nr:MULTISPECIES: glyceraldehyde-3-phosphate dehydrogenase [Bacillaceae]ALC84749.1 glyceraldehyde-3-phosphate dehydrogenase [Bacillus sp. FJAT-22090]KQL32642.1 glyceraldehyde-3-phosphate dehydrogenase [Psychrobacillus sp. FJAT-21963]MDF2067563.1 glyceraldehyde-3-phosphate dehydrogenase [Bacillus sp. Cr_A10]